MFTQHAVVMIWDRDVTSRVVNAPAGKYRGEDGSLFAQPSSFLLLCPELDFLICFQSFLIKIMDIRSIISMTKLRIRFLVNRWGSQLLKAAPLGHGKLTLI